MSWLRKTLNSSIGMKWLMALSGVLLSLFVLAHMIGNLQVFLGPDAINQYADNLQHLGALLWIMRIGLLTIFVVHFVAAIRLTQMNNAARPVKYAVHKAQVSRYASRTMIYGGLFLLFFILFHLAHFTLGFTHPEHFALHDAKGRHDVYAMLVLGFRQPLVVALYVAAMGSLMLHLQHGVSSFFQTLGANSPKYNHIFRAAGPVYGALIFIGNCSIPLAIIAGLLPYPVGGH
jgi:succinate dehydrogenase / fumarate reductase, cytochrome b subunit